MVEKVKRFAATTAAQSAALEGRVVPEGFQRSEKVQKWLDSRKMLQFSELSHK